MEKEWREKKRGEKKGKEEARRKGERKAREGISGGGSEVKREERGVENREKKPTGKSLK